MKERHSRGFSERFAGLSGLQLSCLLGLIGISLFATVRQGHIWGDDFAMYVHHAKNIVEGRAYADTGYIYNPAVPVYGPRTYPPVFPLLLAPLYRFFGLDLLPMKCEQVLFFLGTLAAGYFLWRAELGHGYSLALVAILGFSPTFWAAKDSVSSDLPFLLFFYLAALLVDRTPREQRGCWGWGILIGLALYMAMGTRAAGIALVAGMPLYDFVRQRRVTRVTGVALAVCAVPALAQYRWLGSGQGSYFDLQRSGQATVANIWLYVRALAGFWATSKTGMLAFVALAIVAAMILAGIVFHLRNGLTIMEAFLAPYVVLILLFPHNIGVRATFPLIPWMAFLALCGVRGAAARFGPCHAAAVWGLLALIAMADAVAYRHADFGPIREEVGLPEFNELCQAVHEKTRPKDVLIFYRARALSLYTGRAASTYDYLGSDRELWEWAEKIHASYLITTDAFHDDGGFLDRFAEKHSSNLEVVYRNPRFRLLRISYPSGAGMIQGTSHLGTEAGLVRANVTVTVGVRKLRLPLTK